MRMLLGMCLNKVNRRIPRQKNIKYLLLLNIFFHIYAVTTLPYILKVLYLSHNKYNKKK